MTTLNTDTTEQRMQETVEILPGVTHTNFWSGEGNLSYLLTNASTRQAVLIDPDLEIVGQYLLHFERHNLTLAGVIDTHTHAEHASAGPVLHRLFANAPYLMNENARASAVTDRVADNAERTLAGIPFRFIHVPGHTPDGHAIAVGRHLYTGDSLFLKSCGRADFAGSDPGRSFDSLQRLKALPDDTVIHPGHDYNNELSITLGEARRVNPRLQFSDRDAFVAFMADFYRDNEKPDDFEYYIAFNSR